MIYLGNDMDNDIKQYAIIETHTVDEHYNMFVDVAQVNGEVVTQLYVKTDEPNIFSIMNSLDGFDVEKMIEYGKEHYGKW